MSVYKEKKLIVIPLLILSVIIVAASVWGTYTYSPGTDREFYIWYVLCSVGLLIFSNLAIGLLSSPFSERLLKETQQSIEKFCRLSESFEQHSVRAITIDKPDFDWGDLIGDANEIRLAFKSNEKWLNAHRKDLETFLRKKNTILKIVFPDFRNDSIVKILAEQRFTSVENIVSEIKAAIKLMDDIRTLVGAKKNQLECRLASTLFLSHYYIFPRIAVITVRSLTHHRSPHIVCEKPYKGGGALYDFGLAQFAELWEKKSESINWDNKEFFG